MSDGNTNAMSMGELFKERRAAAARERQEQEREQKQQEKNSPVKANIPKSPSFLEIQQQQEEERIQRVNSGNQLSSYQQNTRGQRSSGRTDSLGTRNSSSNSLGAYFGVDDSREFGNQRDSFNSSRHGRGSRGGNQRDSRNSRQGYRRASSHANLPREEGEIVSLLESFGFIKCAERDEEVFFHFTEVEGKTAAADLVVGDEVEFNIGPSTTSSSKAQKLAAFSVSVLPKGTVKWEVPDYPEGVRKRGKVEKPARVNNNSRSDSSSQLDGTIRLVSSEGVNESEEPKSSSLENPAIENPDEIVRYTVEQYTAEKGEPTRLSRGDLIEFTTVIERRTGNKIAKDILLIQSERERLREEREKKMLAEATLERGVVISLNSDGGFLRSSSRREPVYFQYSNVELPSKDDDNAESNEHSLAEGQDMEFLVCKEEPNGRNKNNRFLAMKIKFLPKDSVQFHENIATGVVGVVSVLPVPSRNRQAHQKMLMRGGTLGKVRLQTTLVLENNESLLEVSIDAEDAPGGVYSANRDGSQVGVWIREGDTLLFDVVKELFDGTYHAKPTSCLSPTENKDHHDKEQSDNGVNKKIRLIQPSLAGRAQGTISAIKDGYAFIACAERNIDVYFRTYELFPSSLQSDMVRFMSSKVKDGNGENASDLSQKLVIGTQVSFDISVVVPGSKENNRRGKSQDKENLIGQRICIVPNGSFVVDVSIAKDVRAVVTQEHKDKSGFVELEAPVTAMSRDDRHPLVAELLNSLVSSGETLVYPTVQGSNETQAVMSMAEQRGLEISFVGGSTNTVSPDPLVNGYAKLKVSKPCLDSNGSSAVDQEKKKTTEPTPEASETDTGSQNSTEGNSITVKTPAKKKSAKRSKPVKLIRFERSCVARDNKGAPPGVGDVVTCDVIQSRRTGAYLATNVKVIERKMIERKAAEPEVSILKPVGITGTGLVTEVVPSRDFGFITQMDEHGLKQEILFFHISNVSVPNTDDTKAVETSGKSGKKWKGKHVTPIKKGDEVRFEIGKNEKNGKRLALNITILPHGTLEIPSKADKNACEGIILMEPSHTSLSNTPVRATTMHGHSGKTLGGRWTDISEAKGKKESGSHLSEEGFILLLSDPRGVFSSNGRRGRSRTMSAASVGEAEKPSRKMSMGDVEEDLAQDAINDLSSHFHVKYLEGGVAVRGAGSFSSVDTGGVPRRGDLVTFVKGKGSRFTAKDIRLVTRSSAVTKRGHLENISFEEGTATFVAEDDSKDRYDLDLKEVVSCDVKLLKKNIAVEGILHDGHIYGVCRTTDLYLSSKVGIGKKERPRLNLTVKREMQNMGGRIVAQSGMAKGPDGTIGFVQGWTKRVSAFVLTDEDNEKNEKKTTDNQSDNGESEEVH